jgi:hypothetical protein
MQRPDRRVANDAALRAANGRNDKPVFCFESERLSERRGKAVDATESAEI